MELILELYFNYIYKSIFCKRYCEIGLLLTSEGPLLLYSLTTLLLKHSFKRFFLKNI